MWPGGDMMGAVTNARARLRAPRALAAAALVAALSLTACSNSPLDRAARVDGEQISDSELHQAAADASRVYQTDVSAAQVLDAVIKTPALRSAAVAANTAVADTYVVDLLRSSGIDDPNDLLVDFYLASAYQRVGITPDPEVLAQTEVEVNPRYGTWDPESSTLVAETPEWIDSGEATGDQR